MSANDVIVLDDQDDVEFAEDASKLRDNKCINYNCQSGLSLMKPSLFCLSYYRIKGKAKEQKVCKDCYQIAGKHFDDLSQALQDDTTLLASIPNINETLTLDSDSEDEDNQEEVHIDPATMEFLEEHLDDVMEECLEKFNLQSTLDNTLGDLRLQIESVNEQMLELPKMLATTHKEFDTMLYELSRALSCPNKILPELMIHEIEELKPWPTIPRKNKLQEGQSTPGSTSPGTGSAAVAGIPKHTPNPPKDLPYHGPIIKPPIKIGSFYFAKRSEIGLTSWQRVVLESIIAPGSKINEIPIRTTMYQVMREVSGKMVRRFVEGRFLAYAQPLAMMLEIGTRVIALFSNSKASRKATNYYPGIVGECPTVFNHYRYLVFFDDGYALYVHYNHVYMIYEYSQPVWEDVYEESRAFIKKYLTEYPNRSMVKFQIGQSVRTEYRGKWYDTTVMEVDYSLVQMSFAIISRVEWIYRGSRRLKTMYEEEQAATHRIQHKQRNARARNRPTNLTGAPFVQYSSVADDTDVVFVSQGPLEKPEQRAVAKKSTRPTPFPNQGRHSRPLPIVQKEEPPPGKIVHYTPRKQAEANHFKPHSCNKNCQKSYHTTLDRLKGYGPLAKPLLCGFFRIHYKAKNRKAFVLYKTPCGRMTRNMEELHYYLRMTKSDLAVDLFNFDPCVRCLAEFLLTPNATQTQDLSENQEEVQIPVVNYIDNTTNEFVNYSTKRMPMEGVNLNTEPEFLCGCDCTDDCRDKTKCACWKLTLEGAKFLKNNPEDVGYVYRRLMEPVITGIYECNSRCKCAKTCLNRVVQNPLQHKLQVFMTGNKRGWGIRCINDIPQGSFICIYAGSLLTDHMANEGGCSDEYYAELDFIEVAEMVKQGYEDHAYDSDNEQEKTERRSHQNLSATTAPVLTPQKSEVSIVAPPILTLEQQEESIRSRLRKRDTEINYRKLQDDMDVSDDEEVREPVSFNPQSDTDDQGAKYPSVRELFGRDENVYIMDAKSTGNLGRFLNHSCSPNVFVQNVFVDTHDLRFPWVSFFALEFISAGTELTWNYNYDVGSVEDKVLFCKCGSTECKGRLL